MVELVDTLGSGSSVRKVMGVRLPPSAPSTSGSLFLGLPANLVPTTFILVAILLFDRSREKGGAGENHRDVFFIDASPGNQSAISRAMWIPLRKKRR